MASSKPDVKHGKHHLSNEQLQQISVTKEDIFSAEEAADAVEIVLEEGIKRMLSNAQGPVGMQFSGGLDSSLVAAGLKRLGAQPTLFVAGQDGAGDREASIVFANKMGLPLHVLEFEWQDLAQNLPELIKRSGSPSLYSIAYQMITDVTIPVALELGFEELWNGTGADLLFAGGGATLRSMANPGVRIGDSVFGIASWAYGIGAIVLLDLLVRPSLDGGPLCQRGK